MVAFMAAMASACICGETSRFGIIDLKVIWLIFFSGIMIMLMAADCFIDQKRTGINGLDSIVHLWFIYTIGNAYIHQVDLLSMRLCQMACLWITYIYTKRLLNDEESVSNLILFSIFILIVFQVTLATSQWFQLIPTLNSNFRFTGFFPNPSPFSIYLAALLTYCLATLFYDTNKITRGIAAVLFFSGLIVVMVSFCRSAWAGLFFAIIFTVDLRFNASRLLFMASLSKKILTGLLIPTTILLSFYGAYCLKKDSADSRLLIWKISSAIIKNKPALGLGPGGVEASFLKYQSAYFQAKPEAIETEGKLTGFVIYSFNDYLQILNEEGVIGASLFIILIIVFIHFSYRAAKNNGLRFSGRRVVLIGAIFSVGVILTSGFFSYPLENLPMQILMYVGIAIVSASNNETTINNNNLRVVPSFRGKVLVLATIGILLGVYLIGYATSLYKTYLSVCKIRNAGFNDITMHQVRCTDYALRQEPWYIAMNCEYDLKRNQLDKAINTLEYEKQFSCEPNIYYALGELYTAQKRYGNAEQQYRFVYFALPDLLKPKYNLAKFYYESNQKDKWNKIAPLVISFKPKVVSQLTTKMKCDIKHLFYKE